MLCFCGHSRLKYVACFPTTRNEGGLDKWGERARRSAKTSRWGDGRRIADDDAPGRAVRVHAGLGRAGRDGHAHAGRAVGRSRVVDGPRRHAAVVQNAGVLLPGGEMRRDGQRGVLLQTVHGREVQRVHREAAADGGIDPPARMAMHRGRAVGD